VLTYRIIGNTVSLDMSKTTTPTLTFTALAARLGCSERTARRKAERHGILPARLNYHTAVFSEAQVRRLEALIRKGGRK
jgi:hypothetical protein